MVLETVEGAEHAAPPTKDLLRGPEGMRRELRLSALCSVLLQGF
jgi:hypothetical protein